MRIDPPDEQPWLILGDFNLIRSPHEKNNGNFHAREAAAFNDTINTLALTELPLLDRQFTWTNNRDNPVLIRLDRAFVNIAWNAAFLTHTCHPCHDLPPITCP